MGATTWRKKSCRHAGQVAAPRMKLGEKQAANSSLTEFPPMLDKKYAAVPAQKWCTTRRFFGAVDYPQASGPEATRAIEGLQLHVGTCGHWSGGFCGHLDTTTAVLRCEKGWWRWRWPCLRRTSDLPALAPQDHLLRLLLWPLLIPLHPPPPPHHHLEAVFFSCADGGKLCMCHSRIAKTGQTALVWQDYSANHISGLLTGRVSLTGCSRSA